MDLTVALKKQKIQLMEVFITDNNLRIKLKCLLLREKVVMSRAKSLFHKSAPKTSDTNPLQFASRIVSKPDIHFAVITYSTIYTV